MLLHTDTPAPLSEDARRPGGLACDPAPARGRVRRVGRCTLARPQVRWPRVSRGGRLVTEVRLRRQSSSPPSDVLYEGGTPNGRACPRMPDN